jgi:hypothetical protein
LEHGTRLLLTSNRKELEMGVYLYPLTKDRKQLEKLARVSEGTYDQLDKMQNDKVPQEFLDEADGDEDFGRFLWMEKAIEVAKLHGFLLNGYGKFMYPIDDCVGIETNRAIAEVMYSTATNRNHFDLDPTGVSWS